jgi:hypothetical protein
VYKRLVEQRFGVAGARDRLAVYYIPGMGTAMPSSMP